MMATLRCCYRLLRVLVHVLMGSLKAAVLFRFYAPQRKMRSIQRWSQQLLSICALRCVVHTEPSQQYHHTQGCLLVANHVSWLDIFVILAWQPALFVSKADVARWPLIGWLTAQAGTLFLRRGSRQAAHAMNAHMACLLEQGHCVAVFPEGTSTDGCSVLPFKPALLQAAVEAQCLVQPLALRYTDAQGQANPALSYAGEDTLWQTLRFLLRQPECTVRLDVLAPVAAEAYDRRQLALICGQNIRARLSVSADLPPAEAAVA